jgi:collagenase-like PrtC family protease
MEYLKSMHEEHGVEAVTIANPLYLWEARKRFKDLEIHVSVLAGIDCLQRAEIYSGAEPNVITPDVNINRDLNLLKDIKKATGTRLKLLVNEGCLYKCPFRKFHFNLSSHLSKETNKGDGVDISFGTFFGACSSVIGQDYSQILKSCWIRPEDIRKYIEITNYFKVVDRSLPSEVIIRIIKAYLEERWDGDLLDLVSGGSKRFSLICGAFLDNRELTHHDFFNNVTSCGHDCRKCNYCQELAAKLIRLQVLTPNKLKELGVDQEIKEELERAGN